MLAIPAYTGEDGKHIPAILATNYIVSTISGATGQNLNAWCDELEAFVTDNEPDRDKFVNYLNANRPNGLLCLGRPIINHTQISAVMARGWTNYQLREAHELILAARNILIPKRTKFVYIKLETGGLDGYDRKGGFVGAHHYPILKITWAIGDKDVQSIIINHDEEKLNSMSEYALNTHSVSGLMAACLESTVTLDQAEQIVIHQLKDAGVLPSSMLDNCYTMLVGNGVEFISNYLKNQMPSLHGYFSPKLIDVNTLNTIGETSHCVSTVFPAYLYSNCSELYVDELREYVMKTTTSFNLQLAK